MTAGTKDAQMTVHTDNFRIVDSNSTDWDQAWDALDLAIMELSDTHELAGRERGDFMLMGARGAQYDFKDIRTRLYLHVRSGSVCNRA